LKIKISKGQTRKKSGSTCCRHSRESGNPVKSIPPWWETPAFAGVTALKTFYETIKGNSQKTEIVDSILEVFFNDARNQNKALLKREKKNEQ